MMTIHGEVSELAVIGRIFIITYTDPDVKLKFHRCESTRLSNVRGTPLLLASGSFIMWSCCNKQYFSSDSTPDSDDRTPGDPQGLWFKEWLAAAPGAAEKIAETDAQIHALGPAADFAYYAEHCAKIPALNPAANCTHIAHYAENRRLSEHGSEEDHLEMDAPQNDDDDSWRSVRASGDW